MQCRSLKFSYPGGPIVLENVDIDFPSGMNILLGPNGAGKSTLLALLASVTAPQEGSIRYGELSLGSQRQALARWRRIVGWVPQQINPIPGMTTLEQVAYLGWLRGLDRDDAMDSARESLDQVGLANRAHAKVSTLSGGQLRRVGIASALVHDCKVIVMDEPMAGLDPGQRSRLVRVVRNLPEVDWIVSTHQTDELAVLAKHVVVMNHGRIAWSGSMASFRATGGAAAGHDDLSMAYAQLVEEEE